MVPRARMSAAAGRLMPIVKVLGTEHVLVVPRLVPVTAADLGRVQGDLTAYRNEIVAALDLLFLGV